MKKVTIGFMAMTLLATMSSFAGESLHCQKKRLLSPWTIMVDANLKNNVGIVSIGKLFAGDDQLQNLGGHTLIEKFDRGTYIEFLNSPNKEHFYLILTNKRVIDANTDRFDGKLNFDAINTNKMECYLSRY